MKMQMPILILAILIFLLPAIGLPQLYEKIIVSILGLLIIVIIYLSNIFKEYKINILNKKQEKEQEKGQEQDFSKIDLAENLEEKIDGQEEK